MSTTSKRQPRVSTDSPALGRWCRFADDEAGHRLVVAACRKGDIELLRHFVGGHPAGEEPRAVRSEEHTSELQSRQYLVCRLLLEKKKNTKKKASTINRKLTKQ